MSRYSPQALKRNDGHIRLDQLGTFVDYIYERKPLGGADKDVIDMAESLRKKIDEERRIMADTD